MRRSFLSERSCELLRGSIGEAAMRPSDIVVQAPRLNRLLRIGQAHEPALVETLVTEPAIEAFRERVLNRLTWLNELQRDTARVRPLIERFACELRPVIADDHRGVAPRGGDVIKHSHDALTWQRE